MSDEDLQQPLLDAALEEEHKRAQWSDEAPAGGDAEGDVNVTVTGSDGDGENENDGDGDGGEGDGDDGARAEAPPAADEQFSSRGELAAIWALGWPMGVSYFCRMAMASTDSVFVGHYEGGHHQPGEYLAASALSDMVTTLLVVPPLARSASSTSHFNFTPRPATSRPRSSRLTRTPRTRLFQFSHPPPPA